MHGENGGHKRAAPQRTCHLMQRNKEKDDGKTVQEDIGKVVPPCV